VSAVDTEHQQTQPSWQETTMRTVFWVVLALVFGAGAAAAQPADHEPMLITHGQGHVKVPPDHARLTVAVVTRGPTLDAATAAHRSRAQRAVDALNGMKKDGLTIEQSSFALNEVRVPPRPNTQQDQEKPQYQATTTFELKLTRMDAVDHAVTAVAATGLLEVRSLRFGIEDNNAGLNAARKKAVEDARARATTYAAAAGVHLGEVFRIEDSGAVAPREFAMRAAAPTMQVIPPQSLTLTASVTMTWRIKP
jgi:uncharacterized protein YggE